MWAQLCAGASVGLLLGLLLGLSSSPAVGLVVGVGAAVLSSFVLPALPPKRGAAIDGDAMAERHRVAAWRGCALCLVCVAALFVAPWLRTHGAMSLEPPPIKALVAELADAGYPTEDALRIAALRAYPQLRPAGPSGAATLFTTIGSPCEKLLPSRYASTSAAAQAYDMLGEVELARAARGLAKHLGDDQQRMAALTAIVDVACGNAR